jgi:general secretion pathway protein J
MRTKQNGLTLVELLVAVGILATVAVLGWRGLDGIIKARLALVSELEQTRGMQLTFAQLQSDCLHLVGPNIPLNHPTINAASERLDMVRTVFTEGRPSRLQVVSYQVSNGVLSRRESAATRNLAELEAAWQSAANNPDTSQAVPLQSGVTTMSTRIWLAGGNGWSIPPNTPVATPNNSLTVSPVPVGLEVSLQLQAQQARLVKVFLLGAS